MMGNWSLGDYFKEEQLSWLWKFLTETLGLPKEKLYATVFEGNKDVSKDEESIHIWKKIGLPDSHIHTYPAKKNWWSRAGEPEKMPAGEVGGPTSEVFFEFTQVSHDKKFGEKCHPNCDCGKFVEIGNSVFMTHKKQSDGSLTELPKKNVDFGGGLERLLMAINNTPDVFKTEVAKAVINSFKKPYPQLEERKEQVLSELTREEQKFQRTLTRGLSEFERMAKNKNVTGKDAVFLYESFGFPIEVT